MQLVQVGTGTQVCHVLCHPLRELWLHDTNNVEVEMGSKRKKLDDTAEILALREELVVDRAFVYDLLTALSELHGRQCAFIGECGDMELATNRAACLESIVHMYNDVEAAAAAIDKRDPQPLEV